MGLAKNATPGHGGTTREDSRGLSWRAFARGFQALSLQDWAVRGWSLFEDCLDGSFTHPLQILEESSSVNNAHCIDASFRQRQVNPSFAPDCLECRGYTKAAHNTAVANRALQPPRREVDGTRNNDGERGVMNGRHGVSGRGIASIVRCIGQEKHERTCGEIAKQ